MSEIVSDPIVHRRDNDPAWSDSRTVANGISPVRILLIDRNSVYRLGMRAMISTDPRLVVIGEANDGLLALELAQSFSPDIIISEQYPLRFNAADLYRELKQAGSTCGVLIFHDDQLPVALPRGEERVSHLSRTACAEDFVRAIHELRQRVHSPDSSLMRARRTKEAGPLPLSKREEGVLRLITLGLNMKEIANRMGLSPRTLETYRLRGMGKLRVKTRAQLVSYGLRQGWFESAEACAP